MRKERLLLNFQTKINIRSDAYNNQTSILKGKNFVKKRLLASLSALIVASLACTIGAPPAPTQPPVQDTAQPAAQDTAVPTALSGTAVSFQNVSFILPSGLASGATSALVPAVGEEESGPWGVAPEHVEFILTGYPIQIGLFEPVVKVYPAQDYAAGNPWAQSSLLRLQGILASPNQPLTNDNLPTIPFNGAAAQQYAAQAKLISFNGGNGVRMVSQYGQFPGPITRDNSFYHYEGLTADGKYMVAILFPVTLPLQSTSDNPSADGVVYPADISDTAGLTAYYQGITDKLNAASVDAFQPSLAQLDALIQSITIVP